MKGSLKFLLVLGLLVSSAIFAQEWEKLSYDSGITAYRRNVQGSSLVEFKGTGAVNANLVNVLAVLSDTDRLSEWVDRVKDLKLIERRSDTEIIYFAVIGSPWPIQNRDYVATGRFLFDNKNNWIHLMSKETTHPKRPPQSGLVRMPLIRVRWSMKPLSENKVWIIFIARADPGGAIPNWLTNLISKTLPLKSIKNLRKQVLKPANPEFIKKYQKYKLWGVSKKKK